MSLKNEEEKVYPTSVVYKEIIIEIADKVCLDTEQPICAKYEEAVANKINLEMGYVNEQKLSPRSVHSTVYRALQKLVKEKKFFQLGKSYFPNKPQYQNKQYITLIKDKICFARNDIHKISDNTYVATLKTEPTSIPKNEILPLLEKFIGEENCYAIKIFDNLLIMMLRGTPAETTIIGTCIEELVHEVYDYHSKKKIRIKKKSKVKQEDM